MAKPKQSAVVVVLENQFSRERKISESLREEIEKMKERLAEQARLNHQKDCKIWDLQRALCEEILEKRAKERERKFT